MFLEYTVLFLSLTAFLLRLFPLPGMPFLAVAPGRTLCFFSSPSSYPPRLLTDSQVSLTRQVLSQCPLYPSIQMCELKAQRTLRSQCPHH